MAITALEEVVDAEVVRTCDEWADILRADQARATESIVTWGRHLIAAKADVQHGEWLPLLDKIGISKSYAAKLMSIGGHLANVSHERHLPGNVTILYELSRLAPEVIESGIAHGDIHPAMTIKDAKGYAQEVADRATPVGIDPDTGEIVDAPDPTDLEREAAFVNDLRLYILHVGASEETKALSPASKERLVAYLHEAARTIQETL